MYVDYRLGGKPKYFMNRPKDADVRVPDAIMECVGFIELFEGPNPVPQGTFFLASVKGPSGLTHIYLVTAKHTAEACDCGDFAISLNDRNGRSVAVQSDERTRWVTHPTDQSVDVATIPLNLDWNVFRPRAIDLAMFATKDRISELQIGVGDEVFMTGLFTKVSDTEKNIPIVRMGNIAMMPNQTIRFGALGEIDAYLIEGRSIGGLSGSPVFVRETLTVKFPDIVEFQPEDKNRPECFIGVGSFYFLGLNIGHWPFDGAQVVEEKQVNMGISVVVPCDKILEVLNHPEFIENRKVAAEKDWAKKGGRPD